MLGDRSTGADSDMIDGAVDMIYFDFLWAQRQSEVPTGRLPVGN